MQTETTLHPEPLLKGMAWLAERGGPAIRGSGREGRISYRGVVAKHDADKLMAVTMAGKGERA